MSELPQVGNFVQFGPAVKDSGELDEHASLGDLKAQTLVVIHPGFQRLREIVHSNDPDVATDAEIIELLAVIRDDTGAHPDHINNVIERLLLAAGQSS